MPSRRRVRPLGHQVARRRRLSIQRDRIVHSALVGTGGGHEYVYAAIVEALDVSGHAEKIGPGTSEYELIEVK